MENATNYAKVKAWREANPEKYRQQRKRTNANYREKHREALVQRRKDNYALNRERELMLNRVWREEHPEENRLIQHKAQARRRVGYDDGSMEFSTILLRDPCSYCGGSADTIDHIVPVDSDGPNQWDNFTAACRSCNASKRVKPMLLFLLDKRCY